LTRYCPGDEDSRTKPSPRRHRRACFPRSGVAMTPPAATGPGRTTSAEGPRAARARAGAASRPGTGRSWQGSAWLGPLAIAVAFVALAWASRGFTPGAAVADDYGFLFRHRFQHPLDLFDSMGARYYWRPLSRQGYFSL